jgi:hypothetical protein
MYLTKGIKIRTFFGMCINFIRFFTEGKNFA